MFKVSHRNTRKRSEKCSMLTIKTPEQRQWRSAIFIVNFERKPHPFLVFLLLNLSKLILARKRTGGRFLHKASSDIFERVLITPLLNTARNVTKYGVFSGPYFPVFGLDTEIYGIKYRKIRTTKSSVFGHFSCSGNHSLLNESFAQYLIF